MGIARSVLSFEFAGGLVAMLVGGYRARATYKQESGVEEKRVEPADQPTAVDTAAVLASDDADLPGDPRSEPGGDTPLTEAGAVECESNTPAEGETRLQDEATAHAESPQEDVPSERELTQEELTQEELSQANEALRRQGQPTIAEVIDDDF